MLIAHNADEEVYLGRIVAKTQTGTCTRAPAKTERTRLRREGGRHFPWSSLH